MTEPLAAIILAGGASRRMGRDKASLLLPNGETLLERTLAAVRSAGATELVVAGDDPGGTLPGEAGSPGAVSPQEAAAPAARPVSGTPSTAEVVFVREDPPRSGPVPALDAALGRITAPLVLVLPCDLADPAAAATELVRAAGGLGAEQDGLVARDADGHRQHLTALFRASALRRGMAAGADATPEAGPAASPAAGSGARSGRVRDRLAGLSLTEVPEAEGRPGTWADLDTPEDVDRWRPSSPPTAQATPAAGTTEPEAQDAGIPGLGPWLHAVARDLDLPPSVVVPGPLLDVARDVARGIIRPGAPTTTYLIGIAVGRVLADGRESPQEIAGLVDRLSARVQDLALGYRPEDRPEDHPGDHTGGHTTEGDRP